jgi:hypothetical protein
MARQTSAEITQAIDDLLDSRVYRQNLRPILEAIRDSFITLDDGEAAVARRRNDKADIAAMTVGESVEAITIDNTGAIYRRVSEEPDHGHFETTANGVIFELRPERATPQMFDAPYLAPGLGEATVDCRPQFQTFIDYCADAGVPGYIPPGQYHWNFADSDECLRPREGMHLTFDPASMVYVNTMDAWEVDETEVDTWKTTGDHVDNWSIRGWRADRTTGGMWAGNVFRANGDNILIEDCHVDNAIRQGRFLLGGSRGSKIVTDAVINGTTTLVSATADFEVEDVGKRIWVQNAVSAAFSDGVIDVGTPTVVTSASRGFKDWHKGSKLTIGGTDYTISAIDSATQVTLATPSATTGTGLSITHKYPLRTTIAGFTSPTTVTLASAAALTATGITAQFIHLGKGITIRACEFRISRDWYGVESGGGVRFSEGTGLVEDTFCVSNDDCFQVVTGRGAGDNDLFGADCINITFRRCRGGAVSGKLCNVSTSTTFGDIAELDHDGDQITQYGYHGNITFDDVKGFGGRGIKISNDSSELGPVDILLNDVEVDCTQATSADNDDIGIEISGRVKRITLRKVKIINPVYSALNIKAAEAPGGYAAGALYPSFIDIDRCWFGAPRTTGYPTARIAKCEDLTIRNSTFMAGDTDAILFGDTSKVVTRGKLIDNLIMDLQTSRRGVQCPGGTVDSEISGNRILKKTGATSTVGIRVQDGNTDLRIARNDLRDVATPMTILPTGTITLFLGFNRGLTPTDPSTLTAGTDANFRDVTHAINTTAKTAAGHKFNTTHGVPMLARAGGAADQWIYTERDFAPITPV